MKVAIVSFDFGEYCVQLANGLSRCASVDLLIQAKVVTPAQHLCDPAVRLHTFEKVRLRSVGRQVWQMTQLVRRLRALKPDVIHLQHRHLWFNLALPFLRDIPLVVTIHDAQHHTGDVRQRFTPEWIAAGGYRRAAQIITHAQAVKQLAAARWGLDMQRMTVMPMITRGETAARQGIAEEAETVLFFGRIWPYKGLDILIRAAAIVSQHYPNFHVIIAGKGEHFDRYARMMHDPACFTVLNRWIDDAERMALFERASIVVLPYIEASQSGVIPVAYHVGKPVIATTVGGLPELVDEGETGLLVPPRDVAALADAILRLLREPALRREMGRNGQRKARTELSADAIAAQTFDVYRRALKAATHDNRVARFGNPATSTRKFLNAALKLHGAIEKRHWNGDALVGPDPGIRWNARIGRFLKSATRIINWSDQHVYIQAQAYWIFDNWQLFDATGDPRFEQIALACSRNLRRIQQPDGHWVFPNPEWRGRIQTVEGCFGALALTESYRRTNNLNFLTGATLWTQFMVEQTGFQHDGDQCCVNYFAGQYKRQIPNNATLAIWQLAELRDVTGSHEHDHLIDGMLTFLAAVQLPTGELPYGVASGGASDRIHFLCYQYNAFEFMDLARYWELTGDERACAIMRPLAAYLADGLTAEGSARYDCHHAAPTVTYYAAAIACALDVATRLGLGDYADLSERGYRWVLSQQHKDGSLRVHSKRNYKILSDRRSYPRYLAMVLHHLLKNAASDWSLVDSKSETTPPIYQQLATSN